MKTLKIMIPRFKYNGNMGFGWTILKLPTWSFIILMGTMFVRIPFWFHCICESSILIIKNNTGNLTQNHSRPFENVGPPLWMLRSIKSFSMTMMRRSWMWRRKHSCTSTTKYKVKNVLNGTLERVWNLNKIILLCY